MFLFNRFLDFVYTSNSLYKFNRHASTEKSGKSSKSLKPFC